MNHSACRWTAFAAITMAAACGAFAVASTAGDTAPKPAASALASPLYGVTIPTGYRRWPLIAPALESEPLNELRAVLGGAATTVQVMVKDSKQYAATGGWGFGRFVDGQPADLAQHQTCFACHAARVRDRDYVFTKLAR